MKVAKNSNDDNNDIKVIHASKEKVFNTAMHLIEEAPALEKSIRKAETKNHDKLCYVFENIFKEI